MKSYEVSLFTSSNILCNSTCSYTNVIFCAFALKTVPANKKEGIIIFTQTKVMIRNKYLFIVTFFS